MEPIFGTNFYDQVIYLVDGKEYGVWKNKPDQVICFYRVEDESFVVSTAYYHITTTEEIIRAIRSSFLI